ncbi:hypothetical protein [Pseudoroseicyclus tamaricis]|uniref:Uncharacterized protein n=1 Tax=Pseudoroseicyclus tamaricis TaxID=2705421 RepID=A0A6B2K1C8_9RHOB|nr:hypothetical protein [Pseudoroseicyclus tamaricis]NDV01522.1 hypothetical protein [Pseudoroseicyclus tamaricis]
MSNTHSDSERPGTRPDQPGQSSRLVAEPSRSRRGKAGLIAAAIVGILVVIALLAWAIPDRGPIEEGLESDPAVGALDSELETTDGVDAVGVDPATGEGADLEPPAEEVLTDDGVPLDEAPPADDTDAGVPASEPVLE